MRRTKSFFYVSVICILLFISSCEKSNYSRTTDILTTGSWKYLGTFLETDGAFSPNDTLIYIPVDIYRYGTWFFNPNGHFKEVRGNDSIAYGEWSYDDSDNMITFLIDNSNYNSIEHISFTKKITSLDGESMIFERELGTISHPISQREIFKHDK